MSTKLCDRCINNVNQIMSTESGAVKQLKNNNFIFTINTPIKKFQLLCGYHNNTDDGSIYIKKCCYESMTLIHNCEYDDKINEILTFSQSELPYYINMKVLQRYDNYEIIISGKLYNAINFQAVESIIRDNNKIIRDKDNIIKELTKQNNILKYLYNKASDNIKKCRRLI